MCFFKECDTGWLLAIPSPLQYADIYIDYSCWVLLAVTCIKPHTSPCYVILKHLFLLLTHKNIQSVIYPALVSVVLIYRDF